MIRTALPILALVALIAPGCDGSTPLAFTPELEDETSFEQGLGNWVVDQPTTSAASAVVTSGGASDGSSYVRMELTKGDDVIWLERTYSLEPSTAYNVTLSADLRSFDGSAELRVGAGAANPNGTGFASEGPLPGEWTRTLAPLPVTTDDKGQVWVALGVASTGQTGAFGVDRLGVVFVRNES